MRRNWKKKPAERPQLRYRMYKRHMQMVHQIARHMSKKLGRLVLDAEAARAIIEVYHKDFFMTHRDLIDGLYTKEFIHGQGDAQNS